MGFIRSPSVAGQFYPSDPTELNILIETLLDEAQYLQEGTPKALIAPHAGLIYSGPVAASAYKQIIPLKNTIKKVVLLGPCHRVAVRGIALSSADFFKTPLGNIKIDKIAVSTALTCPHVNIFDETHKFEHSLEVHLPFLQKVLDGFELTPIIVGEAPSKIVSNVLQQLWGGNETLIIVSSDLSHYLDYGNAKKIDKLTCKAIETLDPTKLTQEGACGRFPVSGLLETAKKFKMGVKTIDLRNSGDTAGPRNRVVGYGAWLFTEYPDSKTSGTPPIHKSNQMEATSVKNTNFEMKTKLLLKEFGTYLLLLASKSIEYGLKHGQSMPIPLHLHPKATQFIGASFVTLKISNQLRGCIGSPIAHRPLALDVLQNGFNAAFRDPRFPKLTRDEYELIDLSISLLSPPQPLNFTNESELLSQLRSGVDGLIIEDSGKQSLFLPSVWTQINEPEDFLRRLKIKAGLKAQHWSSTFKAQIFVSEEISMEDILKTKS